jgi:hypothetical protein
LIAFRDRKGRLWTGRLDVDAALRMRDLAGTDVMELRINPAARADLTPESVCNALYALLLPSAEARGISDHAFGRSVRGRFWGWYQTPRDLGEMFFTEADAFFDVAELAPGNEGKALANPTAEMLWGLLWQVAASAGVEPGPRTFGELIALADAHRKNAWSHTASLLAWIENHAGMGGRRHVSPAERDPTGAMGRPQGAKLEVTPQNFSLVASLFLRN